MICKFIRSHEFHSYNWNIPLFTVQCVIVWCYNLGSTTFIYSCFVFYLKLLADGTACLAHYTCGFYFTFTLIKLWIELNRDDDNSSSYENDSCTHCPFVLCSPVVLNYMCPTVHVSITFNKLPCNAIVVPYYWSSLSEKTYPEPYVVKMYY